MAVLRVVSSSEIAEFAGQLRAFRNVEEKLLVLVSFSPLGGRRKPKNITLLSFNANGLSKNIPELTNCMSEYGVDTALIQETFLKPTRPRACAIAGYAQLRMDRTHASHRTLVIVSVYLPSPQPLHRRDLRALLVLGDAVILFGDFNCKNPRWGCPVLDYNGHKLDQLQDRLEFEIIAPSTATHYPRNVTHRPSTIDIALTKGVALNLNRIETLQKLSSDHRPVLLKMGPPDGGRPNLTCKITDWKRVSTALEKIDTPPLNSIPDNIRTTDEIDSAIELIRAKNKALRRASAYPTPEYRSRARALQREVKARVQEFRNESWSDLMEKIRPSHKAFWKITKALKTEGYTPISPLKRPDGSTALDDAEVAECIADSIETQCSHAFPPHDTAHISRIEEEVLQKTSLEPKDDLTPVSLSEVQLLLLSLLVAIFNACLQNCYFPPAWKEAEVIGIHKPGKPRDLPASYRPIQRFIASVADKVTISRPRRGPRRTENSDFRTAETDAAAYLPPPVTLSSAANARGVPTASRRARSRVTADRVALRITACIRSYRSRELTVCDKPCVQCSDISARVRVCYIRVKLGNTAEPVSTQRTASRGRRCTGVVRRLDSLISCSVSVRRNRCIRAPPDTAAEPVGARPWTATCVTPEQRAAVEPNQRAHANRARDVCNNGTTVTFYRKVNRWNRAAVGHKASTAVCVPRSRASSRASHTGLTWLDCTRRGEAYDSLDRTVHFQPSVQIRLTPWQTAPKHTKMVEKASRLPRPMQERRSAARIVPPEIFMRDILDPTKSRRIPNPVAGRSGDPTPRHTLPEPSVTIEDDDGDTTGSSPGPPAGLGKSTDEVVDYPAKDMPATAEKRRRDSHSSPSPTLGPAPKKADQRTSLNTYTPRSPSLEPYAESTDSTTYAALTLEAVIGEADADIIPDTNTAASPNTAANTGETTHKARGYPPIVVENLPNWVAHFEELRRLIGHAPNARPFGKGIRFLPKSDTEFRIVQRYLQAAARRDHQVTWYCYALEAEKPSKVGIRGLPVDTAPDTIVSALQELDFPAEYVRPIPPRKGRPGCLFYARLGHMNQEQLQRLYGVNTLLNMPTNERALVEAEPTVEGRRRRRRKVRFPLLPRRIHWTPEGTVLTSRPGSCDGDASSVTQVKAHSRGQTRDGPAAADSATEGGTTTREASDNLDLQTNASTANKPDFSTADTDGPEYMAAGAADGDPPDYHGGSGPNPNSAASTAPYPRKTPSSLRVMHWNAGGISGKTQDLRTLVQSQDIHVVLLGETKLRSRQELWLPNFFVYRRDEVSPHGIAYRGTAVLVRRDVVHGGLELPDFINTRTLGIRVGAAGTELRLFAEYRPPGTRFCPSDIRTIFEDHTPTILVGDLNAKHTVWGWRVVSPAGRQLLQDAEDYGYEVLGPDTPSHVPTDPRFGADVLDIVLCHRLPFPIHVEVLYGADTKHLPILITLGTTAHLTPARPQTHRTNWSAYQHALEELHIGRPRTPLRPHIFRQRLAADGTFLYACSALQHKRNLQRLWARTRCPRVKRDLNRVALELRQEVRTFRGAAWEETIGQAGEDWKSLHQLCRSLTKAPAPVCPLFDKTGMRGYATKDRAEILAEHLEEQFTLHPASDSHSIVKHHEEVEHRVREFLSAPIPSLPGDYYVSPTETAGAIFRLPKRKAPGPDGIPIIAIKQLPRRAMVAMTRLFNGILRTASSQRPITLLSHIAKLFERVLLRRLLRHLTPRQEQFGFRSGHSTTLQLARVLHHMAVEHNRGRRTVGVFLDIEKAFDRVWHSGLLYKLIENRIPPALVRTVASFLKDRDFYVSVEDATSDPRPIRAGVPQGSCLSPCLYAVYTDDIPTLTDQLQHWEDVVLVLYADDSAYLASSRRADLAAAKLQRVLDLLPDWLDRWRVAVNVTKTAALLTGKQRAMPTKLRLRGHEVEWQTRVRYLGVQIDRSMRMAAQVDHVIHQSRAARSMLRPVLRSHLLLRAKVALYKGYIRSRLTYAAPAWYALCSSSQRRGSKPTEHHPTDDRSGRYVLNDVIARDLCIETVEEFIQRIARRMFDIADQGLRNIAPMQRSRRAADPPRELTRTPPPKP
ncbi:RNA-directed DNA polymerase from mobile element jockey [Eumeta japonica]|uniref:RNA-directed DNA polymerase from mobile element jockey n=1 Tax=Eumeta variegata TaxID=151549 RepID=A0A4C1XY83_EUMVA|nr:RNA-directed DNA polymerase from mobile element jockey [Eumeta japonica]